jgi:parallel beta-helix repeat protein
MKLTAHLLKMLISGCTFILQITPMKRCIFAFFILSSFAVHAQDDVFRTIQTRAIEAADGDTLFLPEGNYLFNRSINIDGKKNFVVMGAGINKTVLSFKGQIDGAEGLKVNRCEGIVLSNFTIQDAKGDCIKMLNCSDVMIKNVRTEWTSKPSPKNGAYGIYPVSCKNITLDGCEAIGASDAGIYVGQSYDVVVKNCLAKNNVAGIEIENCVNADVYNNIAIENTGGILVFDMPELPLKRGRNIKVHENKIIHNNYKNFAPKGNIVGEVPPGTGVMVLASENVEIYNNEISGHRTASVGIISWFISERPYKDDQYNPFPFIVQVKNNTIVRSKKGPSSQTKVGLLIGFKFGKNPPAIIYDGIIDPAKTAGGPEENPNQICIHGNTDDSFANLDAGNNFKGLSRDGKKYMCK